MKHLKSKSPGCSGPNVGTIAPTLSEKQQQNNTNDKQLKIELKRPMGVAYMGRFI